MEQLKYAIQEQEAWKAQVELATTNAIQERNVKMLMQIIFGKDEDYRNERERRTVERNRLALRDYTASIETPSRGRSLWAT